MLLLISSTGAQSIPHPAVREDFRKVAQRAALAILRSNANRDKNVLVDETVRDAQKAIDEVRIEANSPEEQSIAPFLETFQVAILMNNTTRSILRSQSELDILILKEDPPNHDAAAKNIEASMQDRDEMSNREIACSNAIGDMLRRKLSTELPPCARVELKKEEQKTQITGYGWGQ